MARFGRGEQPEEHRGDKGVKASGADALQLSIAYIKQEAVTPLKGLGRFLAAGLAGSMLIATGTVLLLLATLRILQTETGAFEGNLSWIPYLIVVVLASGVIGLAAWRITAVPTRRRPSDPAEGEMH